MKAQAAIRAVNAIIRDLKDRRGLKHEWERIEPEIQQEIKAEWVGLILTEAREQQEVGV